MTTTPIPASPPEVKCPTCGALSLFAPSNRFRPFCSERCQMIDLGAWGSESFRMPAESPPQDNQYGDPRHED